MRLILFLCLVVIGSGFCGTGADPIVSDGSSSVNEAAHSDDLSPDEIEALIREAEESIQNGKRDLAVELLEKAGRLLRSFRHDTWGFTFRLQLEERRAQLLERLGLTDQALESFQDLLVVRLDETVWAKSPELLRRRAAQIRKKESIRFEGFRFPDVGGERRRLEEFAGRVTLVNFFHPACSPCFIEFSKLQRILEKYSGSGFSMVAVNILPELQPSREDMSTWLHNTGYTFPILVIPDTLESESFCREWDITVTPTNFLLDEEWNIIFRHDGYRRGDEKAIEAEVRFLLGLDPFP